MRTKFYFLLAAVAMFGFTACGDPDEPNPGEAVIKLYQTVDGQDIALEDNANITVTETGSMGIVFDGYVENCTDDFEDIRVKIQGANASSVQFCQGSEGGQCLPAAEEYEVAKDVQAEDIAPFQTHCQPAEGAVAGDEYKATMIFYAEEYPDNTMTVNVTYKYTPAE